MKRLLIAMSVAALTATAVSPVAAREPKHDRSSAGHNLSSPQQDRLAAKKLQAQEMVLQGEATPRGKNKVVKLAPGQFVELAFEGEDQILTLLAEFGSGDVNHTTHLDGPGAVHNGDAMAHNEIPQPNRTVDNSTIWVDDFNREHYNALLYSKGTRPSMANYYLAQSSGAYSVNGYVGDWVTVPNNPAAYGSNYCGDIICADTWHFVNDQADAWWTELVAERGSVAAANEFLESFDIWDRYDADGDGNFDEPDGFIDHFQSVHAGPGEEDDGGALGEDAIWSHRWYAFFTATGPDGSGPNDNGWGGVRIGTSNFWIGDYTVEPENGGVGVFAHEFAHDLGLPDLYDTSGNTGGAENSTGFWTIMSSGSNTSTDNSGLGSYPTDFGAYEKFQLGFLRNFHVAGAGQRGTFDLGPAERNTKKPQAMFIVLPDKEVPLGPAYQGEHFYWGGSGPGLDNRMTKSVTLPGSGDLTLDARVRYDIETDWDYAYVTVNGNPVATNRSTNSNPNGQNFGNGITGSTNEAWVPLTADLTAFAGQTVTIGFRYWTDGFVNEAGFMIDALEIPGQPLDGAEAPAGWTFTPADGFQVADSETVRFFFNAYVLENRTYADYDLALRNGPYNFGFPDRPRLVEKFPYQDGLLISLWDTHYDNNNVGDHPGEGLILPVDAHPAIETWADGSQMRPRIQSYDSTFTKTRTGAITLHNPADGVAKTIASKPAARVFNDGLRDSDGTSIYWAPGHPSDAPSNGRYQAEWNSVNVPNTGTVIRVKSISSSGTMVLDLNE